MAPTAKPNPIPDGYRRVTPALVVNGGVKALEFYAEVFDATERMRLPGSDGTIAHAEIEIGDSVIIVEDASPYMGTNADFRAAGSALDPGMLGRAAQFDGPPAWWVPGDRMGVGFAVSAEVR